MTASDWIAKTVAGPKRFVALTGLALAFLLPGIASLPPTDRDEARFMQASRQMIETGDYAHIRFQNEPRDKKPPGAYWAQAAATKALAPGQPSEPWAYRVPSILGVLAAVLATAMAAQRWLGQTSGFAAGAFLASNFLVVTEGHLAKADGLLFGLSGICFAAMSMAYGRAASPGPLAQIAFWVALGASIVVKGPILPALVILTVAALAIFDRNATWLWRLRPILGLPLVAAVVFAWVQTVGILEASRFVQAAVAEDLAPKLLSGVESHGAPPGTHAVALLFSLWPWSMLIPTAAIAAWRYRSKPEIKFAIAWFVPFWLVAEAAPTKLPHYILPILPALAIVMISATSHMAPEPRPRAVRYLEGLAAFGTPLAFAVLASIAHLDGYLDASPELMTALVIAFLVGALLLDPAERWRRSVLIACLTAFMSGLIFGRILPGATRLDLAGQLARQIKSDASVALVGYHEPSAVFRLGTATLLTDVNGAVDHIRSSANTVAAIESTQVPDAERIAAANGGKLVRIGRASGYNYAKGQAAELTIVAMQP